MRLALPVPAVLCSMFLLYGKSQSGSTALDMLQNELLDLLGIMPETSSSSQ